MLNFILTATLEDLLGTAARAKPLPLPDLRAGAARLGRHLASSWSAGRAALSGAVAGVGSCVGLALFVLPAVVAATWEVLR